MRRIPAYVVVSFVLGTQITYAQTTRSGSPGVTPGATCSDEGHREFDFWVGQWDVMSADGVFAGTSRVTAIAGGCAVQENWTSAKGGFTGQSLNIRDADGRWHQSWVDSSGAHAELVGRIIAGSMVLESDSTATTRNQSPRRRRITWTRQNDDLVRQHRQTSTDSGKTWSTVFDGLYHRIGGGTVSTLTQSFLNKLQGGWIGTGQLMKRASHVELQVEPILGRPVFRLNWRNVVTSEPRVLFEGSAVYEDNGRGDISATWWDTTGAKHSIDATATDAVMTSLWGANGRTTYTLLPSGELEVLDSVKRPDGTWGEFGKSRLKKN